MTDKEKAKKLQPPPPPPPPPKYYSKNYEIRKPVKPDNGKKTDFKLIGLGGSVGTK